MTGAAGSWTVLPGLIFLAALPLDAQVPAGDESLQRLVDAALSVPEVALFPPVRLSPGGGEVAFTVVDLRRRPQGGRSGDWPNSRGVQRFLEGSTVWIAETTGGAVRMPFAGEGSSWGPEWSPDGSRLTFLSDRLGTAQVWIWSPVGNEVRRLSDRSAYAYFGHETPRWMPSGREILVKLLPSNLTMDDLFERPSLDEADGGRVTASVLRSADGEACLEGTAAGARRMRGDLALIDVATGSVRTLVEDQPFAAYWVSPDGGKVAYMRWGHSQGCGSIQPVYDLHVVNVDEGTDRMLVEGIEQVFGLGVSWSPDSRAIAYSEAPFPSRFSGGPGGDLHLVDIEEGTRRILTPDVREPLGSVFDPPLWDGDGTRIHVAAGGRLWRIEVSDGSAEPVLDLKDWYIVRPVSRAFDGTNRIRGGSLLLQARARDGTGFGILRMGSHGEWEVLHELDVTMPDPPFTLDARDDVLAFVAERPDTPPSVWVSVGGAPPSAVLAPNVESLRPCLGEARLVRWRHDDGRTMTGALFLPPNADPEKAPPVVVSLYGGLDGSRYVRSFGGIGFGMWFHPLLTGRGYAVLYPDAPLGVGAPLDDMVRGLVPGMREMGARGLIDISAAALMGTSYGGYSTLAVLTRTAMFRAGLVMAGFSNLTSYYADRGRGETAGLSWMEEGQGRMGSSPWSSRHLYIDNSPFFFLDRITTPVLIVHGTEDTSVPVAHADGTFASLARLGKSAEYVRYQGEGHALWGTANTRDFLVRALSFFELHVPAIAPPGCPAGDGTM